MASKLSGPIPAHPMYDTRPSSALSSKPVPRVRPEAKDIASQHQGSVGNLFVIQGQRVGCTNSSKTKSQPADHFKENVKRMRQIQRTAKGRQEEATKPIKAMWKSEKYTNVQSKVAGEILKEPLPPRPHSASYLRAHSRCGSKTRVSRSPSPAPVAPRPEKLTVPRAASAADVRLQRNDFDFIKINGMAAKQATIKRAPSAMSLAEVENKKEQEFQQYKRGNVPKYLEKRNNQWKREEQERIANMPDPNMPPGHKAMPDSERRATLELLKKSEQDTLYEIQRLPIRNDTLRIKNRRQELEKKLSEIEEAIKIFSRPKVFIKIDE